MKWIDAQVNQPTKDGRYLILATFSNPCISNNSIVRENVPFVSNFTTKKGWMSIISEQTVTYWMEIPSVPKNEFNKVEHEQAIA